MEDTKEEKEQIPSEQSQIPTTPTPMPNKQDYIDPLDIKH